MDDSGKKVRSTGRTSSGNRPPRDARAAEREPRSDILGDGSMAMAGLHVEEEPIFKVDGGALPVFADKIASSTLSGSASYTASAKESAHACDMHVLDVNISDSSDSKPASKRKFRTELMHSSSAQASEDGRDGSGFVSSVKKKIKSSGTPSTFTTMVSRTTAAARFLTESEEIVGKLSSSVVATEAEFESDDERLRVPVGLLEAFASTVDTMAHDKTGVYCDSAYPDSVGSCVVGTSSVSEAPGEFTEELSEPCDVYSMGNDVTMELPKGGSSNRALKNMASLSETAPIQNPVDCGGREIYELLFTTRDPLGFFCATTMGSDGSICYIRSVSPRVKDVRLSSGTIIVATAMGKAGSNSMWHTVGSHYDLKKNYESYRRHSQGKWMQIRFINDAVTHENRLMCSDDWTATFAWQGDPTWEGWAGGAPETHNVTTKDATTPLVFEQRQKTAAPPMPSSTASAASMLKVNHDVISGNAVAGSEDIDNPGEITGVQAAVKPRGRKKPLRLHPVNRSKVVVGLKQPKPILKTRRSLPKQPKSVSFQLGPEDDSVLDSNTGGVLLSSLSTKPKDDDDVVFNSVPSNDDLLSAISRQSCIEVLKLLQAGAIPRPKNAIQKFLPDAAAKRIKVALDCEVKKNPSPELETKCKDIALKVTLLRIFHKVRTTMIASSFLRDWVGYEVSILDVENLHLMSGLPVSNGDKFCCHIRIHGKVVCSFESSLADWSKIRRKKGCHFFNEQLPDHWEGSETTFIVTFTRTYGCDQRTIVLASQKVHLNALKSRTGLKKAITVSMPRTKDLESGQVCITLCKLGNTTRAQIDKHQHHCCKNLNEIINEVQRFNKDQTRKSMEIPTLDFNFHLLGTPCSTLLHCAVHLNNPSLVEHLLACGADTNLQNDGGESPRQLALDMKQKLSNLNSCKEEDMEATRKIFVMLGLNNAGNLLIRPCQETTNEVTTKDDLDSVMEENPGGKKSNSNSASYVSNKEEAQPAAQFTTTAAGVVALNAPAGKNHTERGQADTFLDCEGMTSVRESRNQKDGTAGNVKSNININGML